MFLLPYLQQVCAAHRREFACMFDLIAPVARPVTYLIPALALAGFCGWVRRPRLGLGLLQRPGPLPCSCSPSASG